jgi:enoyl-CoA hydratase
VAGGLEIALACDVTVAARDAPLGVPEVKRGLVAAGGALLRLPQRMPAGMAMRLALTGELIDGEAAAVAGLVDCLSEPGDALGDAMELADTIAANAPLAVLATKRVLKESRSWPQANLWERQREISEPVIASEDAREGAIAFRERRDPIWRRA